VSGYFLSLDADHDLQDIYTYTDEKWGTAQATLYLNGLFEVFDQIGRNPAMGRLRRDLGDDIRGFPHAAHVVFYMPWQGEMAIVRVLHGSMDFESLFGTYNPAPGIENAPR